MEASDSYQGSIGVKIRRLPFLVAMGMEGASRSGVAGSLSERNAMVASFIDGRKSYPKNELIRFAVPEMADERELSLNLVRRHDEILDCLRYQDVDDYEGLKRHVLKVLTVVIAVIQARETPKTVREFKDWLLQIAEHVANAGKEGDFLGIGGVRFSEREKDFYSQLEAQLAP